MRYMVTLVFRERGVCGVNSLRGGRVMVLSWVFGILGDRRSGPEVPTGTLSWASMEVVGVVF